VVDKKVTRSQDFLPDFGAPVVKQKPPAAPIPKPVVEQQAAPAVDTVSNPQAGQKTEIRGPVADSVIEQRIDRRVMVELNAELIVNVGAMDCKTVDLSANGVKLKLTQDLLKNIRINIAGSGEISGEIIWKDDEFIGIKFDEDQSEIVNVLARVTA
jgi:hypothetical protein